MLIYEISYFNQLLKCPRRDLNPRPLPYQGSALPLSYKGNFKVGRVGPFMIACSTMILKCAK